MKYYSVQEIVKVIEALLKHGHGKLIIDFQDHKIPHYDKSESHKPGEGK